MKLWSYDYFKCLWALEIEKVSKNVDSSLGGKQFCFPKKLQFLERCLLIVYSKRYLTHISKGFAQGFSWETRKQSEFLYTGGYNIEFGSIYSLYISILGIFLNKKINNDAPPFFNWCWHGKNLFKTKSLMRYLKKEQKGDCTVYFYFYLHTE